MHIVITGATGFIGRRLRVQLNRNGHEVSILSRNPSKVQGLDTARLFQWSPRERSVPVEALDRADVVIHLAGETVSGRWSSAKKESIRSSRILGTRNLVDALGLCTRRPRLLITASAVGYYGNRGEEPLSENSTRGSGFLADVCRSWEAEAERARNLEVRVAVLRLGLVIGSGGGALQALLPLFKMGLGGPMGGGKQWWPWVHIDDVTGLIEYLLYQDRAEGAFNVASPCPARQRHFAQILGRVLRRPAVVPIPGFALKLVLGEFSSELLASRRVKPEAALRLGYAFRHADLEDALRSIVG